MAKKKLTKSVENQLSTERNGVSPAERNRSNVTDVLQEKQKLQEIEDDDNRHEAGRAMGYLIERRRQRARRRDGRRRGREGHGREGSGSFGCLRGRWVGGSMTVSAVTPVACDDKLSL